MLVVFIIIINYPQMLISFSMLTVTVMLTFFFHTALQPP